MFCLKLHGGSWNNSMPRFAANLGLGTLEPLKPIVTPLPSTSEPVHNMPTVSNSTISEVPAAQFDWNSAGLVNPLDGKFHFHYCYFKYNQLYMLTNL